VAISEKSRLSSRAVNQLMRLRKIYSGAEKINNPLWNVKRQIA